MRRTSTARGREPRRALARTRVHACETGAESIEELRRDLLAAALAFLALGILAAAATVVFKRGERIVGVMIFAMTFAGGAMFPLGVLPGWLEAIGKAMPTRFAFDGMRAALYGGGGWGSDAAVLIGIAVVAIPLSFWLFSLALDRAKRNGSLAQY